MHLYFRYVQVLQLCKVLERVNKEAGCAWSVPDINWPF